MKYYIELVDRRNQHLKQLLIYEGKTVVEALSEAEAEDCYIFSPAKRFILEEVKNFPNSVVIYSGNVSEEVKRVFEEKNITHKNFLSDEFFAYKNAWLTAEGTLAEILIHGQKSLYENSYLLLGFGRCTRALSLLLSKLGIKYDIATFTEKHLEQSSIFAEKTYFKHAFLQDLHKYDVIVNSMPIKVFEDEDLEKFKTNALLLEVSSTKCINDDLERSFNYVLAPALPSKYTHKSAAKLMLNKILGEN